MRISDDSSVLGNSSLRAVHCTDHCPWRGPEVCPNVHTLVDLAVTHDTNFSGICVMNAVFCGCGVRAAVRYSVGRQLSEAQSPFQTGGGLMRSRTAALWEEEELRVKNWRTVFNTARCN